jgi:RNA binding exosome subunit
MTGGEHTYRAAILDPVRKFLWNNLKPVYAMEHIGSSTLTKVFDNVRSGEDTWAKDVVEAREYYLDKSKKYGYDSWDFEKKYRFKSASGLEFELTLEQILSLYAYSKRDQAGDHLKLGGFVFDSNIETYKEKGSKILKYKVNTADAHQITPEILASITGTLSKEQTAFVDEMQDYLSTVMGAKGNEVTMKMYGVKLFKEKFYFPLKSAKQFMFEQNEVSGEVKIKNSGFTNKVVAKANNPVILSNFMEVWAGHVNDMSMYHAFVLPLEDFNRVFNYNSPKRENQPPVSVKGTIQSAYSPAAVSYVKNLITDLNGGARSDSTTGFINKMMGLFKKGSVFASLSVVVQQPSAIARAAALVNTKYFIGPKVDHKRHKALWDEVKQYAPVAIIKEMGYFDTNMGKSTQDFILSKEYSGFKDKMAALVKDSGYRDEVLSKAPALADELAWCSIWEAVKREMHDKNPGLDVKSEAFLQKAGERFTEVITKTQVYDSVLSRSALMRSKDTGMKMATAFMAEPTTSINMIADALLKGKRGNKKYARGAIGAVIASQILNSILVSFVYAGRDDDEDETYLEKYIGSLTGEIVDSLNPAGYIPFIKDIMSIVQGYDVERSDMAVISDLWNAIQNLSKDNVSAYRKVEGFAGSIAQIFGLPVKNIMRDARGIFQTVTSFGNGQQTTAAGIGYAIKGAVTGKTVSDQQQLYEAYLSGDPVQIARVEERFEDQKTINAAIRKALRENDPRIKEAAAEKVKGDLDDYLKIAKQIIKEKNFSQDDVVAAINAEINAMTSSGSTSSSTKASGMFKAEDFAVAISQGDTAMANAVKTDIIQTAQKNGKTAEEAEKSFVSSATSACKDLFDAGEMTEGEAINALTNFCGKTEEEAASKVQYWVFKQDYPDVYVDDAWIDEYYEEVAYSGIEIDVFVEYRNQVKDITGEGKKEERMAVINSMPISRSQKDALYYAEGWAASKIHEAPWR